MVFIENHFERKRKEKGFHVFIKNHGFHGFIENHGFNGFLFIKKSLL